MKKEFLLLLLTVLSVTGLQAQVKQINSNKSLDFNYPLSSTKAVYLSATDQTLWVTDGTLAGTLQLSPAIKYSGALGSTSFLNGKLIFAGTTLATGTELYITDGTPAGTSLVKDINTGAASSAPDGDAAVLNGFIYFTAVTATEGRELWRTDGTSSGTTLVKDIIPGPTGSNAIDSFNLFVNGNYILFAASTPSNGVELYKSDGTSGGTNLLLDINTANAGKDSSSPRSFYNINNKVIFAATDATHGDEIWVTDGTAGGTQLLNDINPGMGSSTKIELFPGFSSSIFSFFHTFNNEAYFNAYNGVSAGQVWKTDGIPGNTTLLKDIIPGPSVIPPLFLLINAIDLPGKFIFPVSDLASRNELWESDGTIANTQLFKSFDGGEIPFLFPAYNFYAPSLNQQQVLFQGNKFFFEAKTAADGRELWISDGTLANTQIVKDIKTGTGDGLPGSNISYTYTSGALYFPGDNTTNGVELWKSDGTSGGTTLVADIVTGATGSDTRLDFFIINNKVVFGADNGDNATETDLYAVDGIFTPLPVKLLDFTITLKLTDAVLNWRTSQEINSKDYTIQRSFDGRNFESIGTVSAPAIPPPAMPILLLMQVLSTAVKVLFITD
jgi:ELWxxDGT repeat protein